MDKNKDKDQTGRMENTEIWNPDPESGTGTGTGTGQINECFKLGGVIRINSTPPYSTFITTWMMICGALLRKVRVQRA